MTRPALRTPTSRFNLLTLLAATGLLAASPHAIAAQQGDSTAPTVVERKGFVIGFGLGVARVTSSASEGPLSVSISTTGVGTDFKIGYAPNHQLLIYWSADGAFSSPPSEFSDEDGLLYSGLGGIGATYFLSPGENSFFLTAALGRATDGAIGSDGTADSVSGTGLAIGGGYEFTPHWVVDGDIVFNSFSDFGMDYSQRFIRIGVSYLHY